MKIKHATFYQFKVTNTIYGNTFVEIYKTKKEATKVKKSYSSGYNVTSPITKY